jgi:hypothetical protein
MIKPNSLSKVKLSRLLVLSGLLFFVALLGLSTVTNAATNPQSGGIGLQGTISSPAPTQGATIASPAGGATFTALPITVVGWCPSNLLVKIFKNNVFGGSTMCASNSYSVKIDLFSGQNDIIARVYDALDQAGPDSATVSVTFNDNSAVAGVANRVSLTSNYARRGADPKTDLTWPVIISGGTAPFAVSVDWGDGNTNDLYSVLIPGEFTIKHQYGQSGTYNVLVKASDKNGSVAYLQLVAVSNGQVSQTNSNVAGATASKNQSASFPWQWALLALVLIGISYWLGRRSEASNVKKRIGQGLPPL